MPWKSWAQMADFRKLLECIISVNQTQKLSSQLQTMTKKSGCTRKRTYFPVPQAEKWNTRKAKDIEILAAKKCIGKSMFYLALDTTIAQQGSSICH